MKQRVGAMVGQIVEGMPWLGTFHSIGVKILRRHAELVGLKPDFTILDVDDQIRLLKQLLAAEDIDEKRWPARVLAGLIDSWKNRGLTPDQVPAGEGRELRRRQGQEALCRLSGAAEGAQRRRFRRPPARMHPPVPRAARGAAPVSGAASGTSWSTSIRTPTSRSISGCGCWGRARASPSRRRRCERGSTRAMRIKRSARIRIRSWRHRGHRDPHA